MSHFTRLSIQFQDLDVLQSALETLGFGVARKCEAWDFFGRSVGVYPLVVPKQGKLHADIYAAEDGNGTGYSLHADSMDQEYLESLAISQRYAQVMIERFALQHGMFVESAVGEDGTIEYQLVSV